MIRELNIKDINSVSRLHKRELSGFLPELGEEFLQLFYKTGFEIPEMFTFVDADGGTVKGFVTCISKTKNLYKKIILRRPLQFIVLFLMYFITHPLQTAKFVRILSYPGFSDTGAELLSIAVSRDYQLKGIGRKLFLKSVAEFERRGIRKFKISVYDRLPANGFYKKIGCRLISSFNFLGEKMNYFEYKTGV